jgi:phosphodiesterase/alkaline phosphatase D-like protein
MKRLAFFTSVLFAMSIGVAAAGSPPKITKVWHWHVAATTAGLSMNFSTNELQTTWSWFQVSTDPDLAGAVRHAYASHKVQWDVLIASNVMLTDLKPNTTYFYRAAVRNNDGEVQGKIEHFRTSPG